MTTPSSSPAPELRIAVVVPVKNERDNLTPLISEIEDALKDYQPFEIIYVDDGSTDGTSEKLIELSRTKPHLRVFRHRYSCGQSSAVRTGVREARASLVATLDGDGQNNPAYIPVLIKALELAGPQCGLAAGQRIGRKDTPFKRFQSRLANKVRGAILKDSTRDSGCGLKVFRRDAYLALPYFDALHRFMPALMLREGLRVTHAEVVDRPRLTGVSNYGFFDRLWVGLLDLYGVWWLRRRRRTIPHVTEMTEHGHVN